jgi:uncharacterized protein DUF3617
MKPVCERTLGGTALAVGMLALVVAGGTNAQNADDLYEVTVRMEMAGMPMQMPATTQQVCVKKGGSDADLVPHRDNCKVSDARRSGNRLTFAMTCTGRDAMTGNGDFTVTGSGYDGRIRLKGKMEDRDVEMTQMIAGRRVGGCTAR